jgi:hypothetical protein
MKGTAQETGQSDRQLSKSFKLPELEAGDEQGDYPYLHKITGLKATPYEDGGERDCITASGVQRYVVH